MDPLNVEAITNKGCSLNILGRYSEGLESFSRVAELAPNKGRSWDNLGYTYYKLDKYEEAQEACKKATALDPDFANAWLNLAVIYLNTDQREEGLGNLRKAIEKDPSLKEKARKDKDLKALWEDLDFIEIVGKEESE